MTNHHRITLMQTILTYVYTVFPKCYVLDMRRITSVILSRLGGRDHFKTKQRSLLRKKLHKNLHVVKLKHFFTK